jgi:hypothetical protein
MRLFDWNAYSGAERDFEYVQCVVLDESSGDSEPGPFLIKAVDAALTYLG